MATSEQLAARDRLIAAGRAPMPKGFEWDFSVIWQSGSCGTAGCMIGLAIEIGLIRDEGSSKITRLAEKIGITSKDAYDVFLGFYSYDVPCDAVTPAMVADRLAELPR